MEGGEGGSGGGEKEGERGEEIGRGRVSGEGKWRRWNGTGRRWSRRR